MIGNSPIRFSVFDLDRETGELRRNGSKVPLQEQPFQILVCLLERPGKVVTRDELRRKLWPADTFVDFDHGLNAAIRRLREALDDSANTPRFVETVARRGYRFIAPVEQPLPSTIQPSAKPQAASFEPEPARPVEGAPAVISTHRWRTRQVGITAVVAGILLVTAVFTIRHVRHLSARQAGFSQRRLTANTRELPVVGAALSPSGKYLAFSDATGLYLRHVDSGETHPVPLPTGFNANPESWFADENHLLVRAWTTKASPSLWRISIMGGAPQLLIDNGSSGVVSPDGKQIAFVRRLESSQEILLMQANGERPAQVFACNNCFFLELTWSPDGKWLAYVRHVFWWTAEVDPGGTLEIFDLDRKRSEVVEDRAAGAVTWGGDGRIIYAVGESPPNQNGSNLWALDVNPRTMIPLGAPQRLTGDSGWIRGVSASADGKKLAILRQTITPQVYVAELLDHGGRLSIPRLLTLDEWVDLPTAWTPDSKSVLFQSDRDGVFHIFKQALDQAQPELLVGGNEPAVLPRLSPDGSMVIYQIPPHEGSSVTRIMRVPVGGGPPQLVLESTSVGNQQCAKLPSTLCIYSEFLLGEERFYTFDPFKGKGEEIPRAARHGGSGLNINWSLSPDGKSLAFPSDLQSEPSITLFSLADAKERLIPLPGWDRIYQLDWSADGHSIWVGTFRVSKERTLFGTTALVKVELSGKVTSMLQDSQMIVGWAIPSPDGSKLAIWESKGNSNVWLLDSR